MSLGLITSPTFKSCAAASTSTDCGLDELTKAIRATNATTNTKMDTMRTVTFKPVRLMRLIMMILLVKKKLVFFAFPDQAAGKDSLEKSRIGLDFVFNGFLYILDHCIQRYHHKIRAEILRFHGEPESLHDLQGFCHNR